MTTRKEAKVIELAYEAYALWAMDAQAPGIIMPQLGEALKALDPDRAAEAFRLGVESARMARA